MGGGGRADAPSLAALVYAYELFGSVKEITALAMILALGALVVMQDRVGARAGPRGVIPFALVVAAGHLRARRRVRGVGARRRRWCSCPRSGASCASGAGRARGRALATPRRWVCSVALLAALADVDLGRRARSRSPQGSPSTSNPGNLTHALRAIQLFGIWLGGSYKLEPTGIALGFTHGLIAGGLLAGVGWASGSCARLRALALLAWFGLMLLACLIVVESVVGVGCGEDADAELPGGRAAGVGGGRRRCRALRPRALALLCSACARGSCSPAGVLASDASQYHVSNLAPTGRYEELARLNSRFAGRGPRCSPTSTNTPCTCLRDLDVGGPDFVYPPPAAAAAAAGGHGRPVRLDRLAPSRAGAPTR